MRNALFFDIDGTLLSDVTGKIPDSALDALKKTIELGNLTFINTGRCYCSVPMELKRAPFSGYLCGCGTYIMLGDEVMFSRIIPHKRGREIIRVLQENHAEPILEATDDCYFSKRITRFEGIEHTRRYFAPMGLGIETYIGQRHRLYSGTHEHSNGKRLCVRGQQQRSSNVSVCKTCRCHGRTQ